MKGYSFRSLTDLVLKIFKTKVNAGTGLSGGGSLEADRTLSVKYGTAAGTATQGNDSRVVNAASNATVNAKEAALEAKKANKAITITASTGLSGGGSLAANRSLSVKYGIDSGTAAQGNDSRLSNSREWTASTVSQAEAEVGLATTRRAFTAQRVRQAIVAWWNSITGVFGRDLVTSTSNRVARDKLGLFTSALRWPTFEEVTDKPTTYTPSLHTHLWEQVTGQPVTATRWPSLAEVTGKPINYPTTWDSVAAKPAQATRWPTFAEVTDKPTNYPTNWATVSNKPVVQTTGTSTKNLMSQKAITDALGQPSITVSATLNGTTNNTVQLTDIVTKLGLEVGDVIRIQYSGYNKLHSVESITNNDLIIVNYEHAGNRGNGSLKLADQSTTVTITRIAKWYNAPLGMGQAWVKLGISKNTTYTVGINRPVAMVIKDSLNNGSLDLILTTSSFSEVIQVAAGADYQARPFTFILEINASFEITGGSSIGYFYMKR